MKNARANTDAKISLINVKNQFTLRDKKKEENSSGTLKKSGNCGKEDVM